MECLLSMNVITESILKIIQRRLIVLNKSMSVKIMLKILCSCLKVNYITLNQKLYRVS